MEEYKNIELTEEEIDEAILAAKIRKQELQREAHIRSIEAHNRRMLRDSTWTVQQTTDFMKYRAGQIFKGEFQLDDFNSEVFELLCLYFSNDINFVSRAINADIENASLEKGILLSSSYGHGKTWMMQLFSKNQRQVFFMRSAKKIANDYENFKEEGLAEYMEPYKNAINDVSNFYHPFAALCIDDIGTEGVKQNYGNKRNVIGDIIEQRYATNVIMPGKPELRKTGIMLHGTTNLTGIDIHNVYGGRVASRIREIFNVIELPGKDRRK